MDNDRWTTLVGLIFSPAGWILMAVTAAFIGFIGDIIVDWLSGERVKRRRDGRGEESS